MKSNKIIISISFILIISSVLLINNVSAIQFKPAVPIPGMPEEITIGPDSIGNYINIFYAYAARVASLLAMLMLVIAAWQWLFAAGSPEKISNAKNTITGALLGLTLLFGGHLLLSQISSGLVELKPITLQEITGIEMCNTQNSIDHSCGSPFSITSTSEGEDGDVELMVCLGLKCSNDEEVCAKGTAGNYEDCVVGTADLANDCSCVNACPSNMNSCDDYQSVSAANMNLCFDARTTIPGSVCISWLNDIVGGTCNTWQEQQVTNPKYFIAVCYGHDTGSAKGHELANLNCDDKKGFCKDHDVDNAPGINPDTLTDYDYCCDWGGINECQKEKIGNDYNGQCFENSWDHSGR